jgi:hypothetical protein
MLTMAVLSILSVSVFAQDSAMQKMKAHKQKTEKVRYSCPMHPGETSKKSGKCTICGMDMKKIEKVTLVYSCPMKCEGDKTYDKPGKCPVCGMNLKENEKATVVYSCPMKCEGDKTYDKPGKCPVCGMNLKEKKDDHANHQH